MKRVRSLGGVFFRTDDPEKTREWYKKHLGLGTDEWGSNFVWRKGDKPNEEGFTLWSPFDSDSEYFGATDQPFMLNFRVENLEELLEILKGEGVEIVDEIQYFDYGKFVHILDGDGKRVELWEPNDEEYSKMIGPASRTE